MILDHRAFANAESLALTAGLIGRLFLIGIDFVLGVEVLVLAQRALCAAAIFARPAALIVWRLTGLAVTGVEPPTREASSRPSISIVSLISAARRNAVALMEDKSVVIVRGV